uniref:Uncharacterized protein n=1 Tax=Ananas comosus var. bracteatus TaxID=296719 RepID=A0A6V7P5C2_ANACO|nr:unnamed protein product [Ananas comosus var. bracteatus]
MAAIKRSQANQRRNPVTFHLYQQQAAAAAAASSSSSTFSGVKVELQQLVLAILDDPVVSRVFGEAGFRSCNIKLAILRPPPPFLRFPAPRGARRSSSATSPPGTTSRPRLRLPLRAAPSPPGSDSSPAAATAPPPAGPSSNLSGRDGGLRQR